jgi:methylenetetrahydrofolate dehydrogenase (NADP+) / methenyltetrahydrofolate cyclohydrolase
MRRSTHLGAARHARSSRRALVFDAIAPCEDVVVDGKGDRRAGFASCMPGGILALLDAYTVPIIGEHVAVVGAGRASVRRPLLLLDHDATMTISHSPTRNLEQASSER